MIEKRSLSLGRLERGRPHRFQYVPAADEISEIKAALDLRKLMIEAISGVLEPEARGWHLRAEIIGHATQNCVISGAPVQNTLRLPVERIFERAPEPLAGDLTLSGDFDDRVEPMPPALDLLHLITEGLALALPEYPKLAKYRDNDLDGVAESNHVGTVIYQDAEPEHESDGEKPNPFDALAGLFPEKNGDKKQ